MPQDVLRNGYATHEGILTSLNKAELTFVNHVENHSRHDAATRSIQRKECLACDSIEVYRIRFDSEDVLELQEIDIAWDSARIDDHLTSTNLGRCISLEHIDAGIGLELCHIDVLYEECILLPCIACIHIAMSDHTVICIFTLGKLNQGLQCTDALGCQGAVYRNIGRVVLSGPCGALYAHPVASVRANLISADTHKAGISLSR